MTLKVIKRRTDEKVRGIYIPAADCKALLYTIRPYTLLYNLMIEVAESPQVRAFKSHTLFHWGMTVRDMEILTEYYLEQHISTAFATGVCCYYQDERCPDQHCIIRANADGSEDLVGSGPLAGQYLKLLAVMGTGKYAYLVKR